MIAFSWRTMVIGLLMASLVACGRLAAYYGEKYTEAKTQLKYSEAVSKSIMASIAVNAELDIKYTKELADAKSDNDRLRADVASGIKRLRINATCQAGNTAAASSVGNAATPTITADAERDYWRLQTGIETASRQVKYLQEYINNVCLK